MRTAFARNLFNYVLGGIEVCKYRIRIKANFYIQIDISRTTGDWNDMIQV